MSCSHRMIGRWGRVWNAWLAAAVGSFALLETVALTTQGPPATLSAYIRRVLGLNPACRHGRAGRGLLFAALGWAAVHLGFGVLGVGGRV